MEKEISTDFTCMDSCVAGVHRGHTHADPLDARGVEAGSLPAQCSGLIGSDSVRLDSAH